MAKCRRCGDEMMVWVVEEGSYSDKCVVAVFSSKAKADDYARLHDCHVYDALEVDTAGPLSDTHERIEAWEVGITLDDGAIDHPWQDERVVPRGKRGGTETCTKYGWAKGWSRESADHAIKLAVEARQAWLRRKSV